MKTLILYAFAIILVVALSYGGYRFDRYVNWTFQYSSNVESMIKEHVKINCLVER